MFAFLKKPIEFVVQLTAIVLMILIEIDAAPAYAGKCGQCQATVATLRCSRCRSEHYCDAACQRTHWSSHKAICEAISLFEPIAGGVTIGPSQIEGAGNGLIATKNFSPGDLVAAYYGKRHEASITNKIRLSGRAYLQDLPDGSSIDGAKTPPHPHLGAQLANDPYVTADQVERFKSVDCAAIEAGEAGDFLSFMKQSAKTYYHDLFEGKRQNISISFSASVKLSFPKFIAARAIEKGSEIFYPYGFDYWSSIPGRICSRKAFFEASVMIHRAVSLGLEELVTEEAHRYPRMRSFLIDDNPSYLSEKQANINRALISKSFLLQMEHLFGNPGSFAIESYQDGSHPRDRFFTLLRAELDIDRRIAELRQAPNSEFFDEDNKSKIHPKSKDLLRVLAAFMQDEMGQPMSWFLDRPTLNPIPWKCLLETLD